MGVKVKWDNDAHTIIVWTIEARFTWADVDRAWDETRAMLESAKPPVDLIFDVHEVRMLPTDTITYIRRKYQTKHPNRDIIAAVGVDKIIRLFWDTYITIAAPHLKPSFFDTVEEARAFIQQRRAGSGAQHPLLR